MLKFEDLSAQFKSHASGRCSWGIKLCTLNPLQNFKIALPLLIPELYCSPWRAELPKGHEDRSHFGNHYIRPMTLFFFGKHRTRLLSESARTYTTDTSRNALIEGAGFTPSLFPWHPGAPGTQGVVRGSLSFLQPPGCCIFLWLFCGPWPASHSGAGSF